MREAERDCSIRSRPHRDFIYRRALREVSTRPSDQDVGSGRGNPMGKYRNTAR